MKQRQLLANEAKMRFPQMHWRSIWVVCFSLLIAFSSSPVLAGVQAKVCVHITASASPDLSGTSVTFADTTIPLDDSGKGVEVTIGKAYTLSLNGSFDNPPQSASATIRATISSCFEILVDGEWRPSGTAITRVFGSNGSNEPINYQIKIVMPKDDSTGDFGAGGAGSNSCGCSIDCDKQTGGGGAASGGGGPPQAPGMDPEMDFEAGMGRDSSGIPIGTIRFNQQLSNGSISRQNLQFFPISSEGEAISDGGGLRQVYGPEGLADVVEIPTGIIEIRYYSIQNVGPKDGNGLYTVNGAPVVVHRLAVGTNGIAGNGVVYSATRDGETTTEAFYGTGGINGGITRDIHADGRITETLSEVNVDPSDSSIWTRIVLIRELMISSGSEVLTSERREEYASRSWGEVLERSIDDPNGANLVTSYGYYESLQNDGVAYKKRKHVIQPNGDWERYTYNSRGGIEKTHRPWKDLPASPDSATDSNCQYQLNLYDSEGQINGSQEFVLGILTGRTQTYEISWDSEYDGSQFRDLITTENWKYHANDWVGLSSSNSYLRDSSGPVPRKGDLYRSVSANRSAARYVQTTGDFNEGTGVFTVNSAGAFTRRVTTVGTSSSVQGIANRTTRTVTIADRKGPRRTELQIYTGSAYETASVTSYQYETGPGRRLLSTTKDGAVVASRTFASSLETTETDESGIATTMTVDTSGRLLQVVKAGVPAGSDHEAQAPIVTTYQEDGLTSSETTVADALSLTTTTTKDLTGRVVSNTDASGSVTTFAYTNGGRTITITAPGGATRITAQYLDGRMKSITGTGVVPQFHDYEVDGSGNIVHTVYYGTGDSSSPRWEKSVTNGLDQLIREEKPGSNVASIVTTHGYNDKGLRTSSTRTELAATLYEYDALGREIRQGMDLDESGSLELTSADPISGSDNFYEKDGNGAWWDVQWNGQYLTDGNGTDIAATVRKVRLGVGPNSVVMDITPKGNTTLSIVTVDRPNKSVSTVTTSSLSNLSATALSVNGLSVSKSTLTVASPILIRYDALGRPTQQLDSRTSLPTTTEYDAFGHISSVADGASNATTFSYYGSNHANAGQIATRTNAEGETTRYSYDLVGRLQFQWGNASYPVAYSYNNFDEQTEMKTFREAGDWNSASVPASFFSATPALTVWGYDPGSGLLLSKTDNANHTVSYTYHNSGLQATRTWARGVSASYSYDAVGRMISVDYSDDTPDVTTSYRRDGQPLLIADAAGSHSFTYSGGTGAVENEELTAGLLDGLGVAWEVDGAKRPSRIRSTLNGAPLSNSLYGYDAMSRINKVTAGRRSADYSYVPNSNLLQTTALKRDGVAQSTGTRFFDDANRLASLAWASDGTTTSSHTYNYDGTNRRLRLDLLDGAYWEYGYNDKGEVIASVKKSSSGGAYPGLNRGYAFDEIGNRVTTSVDAEGGGSRTAVYTANSVNEYSAITHPSALDVIGSAVGSATVTVNTLATQRLGTYFRKQLPANNAGQPAWETVEVVASLPGAGVGGAAIVTSRSGHSYVAPAIEAPVYDVDGNLIEDGRWLYLWDAENRLIRLETAPASIGVGVPKRRIEFAYDARHRRILKKVYDWDSVSSQWTLRAERRFVYDQSNLIAELDGSGNLIKAHTWGLDISGELQTGGGVGGLLWSDDFGLGRGYFVNCDGNGNVTALVDSTTGKLAASRDYDAFGNTLQLADIGENTNPFWFSSHYADDETGLVYAKRRYYSTGNGRWLSRDPLEEAGGINLFGYVENSAPNRYDLFGLKAGGLYRTEREAAEAALDDAFLATAQSVPRGIKEHMAKFRPGTPASVIQGQASLGDYHRVGPDQNGVWYVVYGIEHGGFVYSLMINNELKFSYGYLMEGVIRKEPKYFGAVSLGTWDKAKHAHPNHTLLVCKPAAGYHSHNVKSDPPLADYKFSSKDETWANEIGKVPLWLIDLKRNKKRYPEE